MKRLRACALLLGAMLAALPLALSAEQGTKISGRILDTQGGLPVPNATIELDRGGTKVTEVHTDADGNFAFPSEPAGTYVIFIRASGYQTTRVTPDLVVSPGLPEVAFQTAISRQPTGMKTIAYVTTAGRQALQTTSTINTHVDTSLLQSENFQRLGDVLTTVPGVITGTSSSVGDDMSLSIRGFDSTETATLLDGHPIGPTGAGGGGYNYNVSPFWGLSAVDVYFGSGATGLFGTHTIAGAVNWQTIDPTRENHFSVTQGVGTNDKLMTGFLGTGTVGKLGYALAWGVQGTNGNFPGAVTTQKALLQTSVVHPGFKGNAPPPDMTSENVGSTLNTYYVTGQYSQYNFVGKLRYDFSPKTSLQFTAYSANDWSNSTGEGDNDYQTFPYVLYGAEQTIGGLPNHLDTILVNGKQRSCYNKIAVLTSGPNGYTCMNADQYAVNFYGPFGGSVARWRTLGNQDYDGRFTQQLGAGIITLDGFIDAYNYNEQKGPGQTIGAYTSYGPGPFYLNLYKNRGFLVSDDFPMSKNDFAFGYTWLRQANSNGYSVPNAAGTHIAYFTYNPALYLATASYFVRDTWTPNTKFTAFANVWLQRSLDTRTTFFDPRLSLVYRPDHADVVRFSTGKSYNEPDPSLIALAPPVYGAPSSVNCPPDTSGTGSLTSIASVADPNLRPETASDLEFAYGHGFNATTNIQADVYQAWEQQALLGGLVPITQIPQVTVPPALINEYLARLDSCPGLHPTINSLAFSTTYNASSARYRGIVLSTNVGIARGVVFNASYNIQSAAFIGVPQDILQANTDLLDGGQVGGVPLHAGTAGLAYTNPTGFSARMDANYIGSPNTWNRDPFWFVNGNVSQSSSDGKTTVSLGVYNLFNSAAQRYGYIGYGVYVPQNYYGLAAQGGPTSAIQQGTEQYGLPFRQVWLTVKVGI
ncbi:MAG: TonB-dependent receptor [Candidatus Eremiobacteraeota bacterium]|nr:TonB-dependent receptor [Candidatus Eremiobacteraeota bacterium]